MSRSRNEEDLLNPDRVYYRLLQEYADGSLTKHQLKLYRARVEAVSLVAGDLENNPPCPPNSVRARVYTSGLDANLPSIALNIFHPLLPGHLSPPISIGEHVYVTFEDANFSHGLWISTISSLSELNNSDPSLLSSSVSDASDVHDPRPPNNNRPNPLREGLSATSVRHSGRQELPNTFNDPASNPWRGKRVLMIGDSMVGGAIKSDGSRQPQGPCPTALQQKLEAAGASFFMVAGRVGWGVNNWLTGRHPRPRGLAIPQKSVAELKQDYGANIVLMILGGNDASTASRGEYEGLVRRLWGEVSAGTDFAIWCGPPTVLSLGAEFQARRDVANDKILSVVGANFIDCRALTREEQYQDTRDNRGVHWPRRDPIGDPWSQLFFDKARQL